MKKIVIKIKWLLYKEQEKQYPILSFILDNIDDIDSIIKKHFRLFSLEVCGGFIHRINTVQKTNLANTEV